MGNYSVQFRGFADMDDDGYYGNTFDQIAYLVKGIKDHPYSRRNVITTWNTAEMADPECPITNCHGTVIQVFVDKKNKLHLVTYQRSVDVIVGMPHNIFQYWAFLMWLAHRGGREVGTLTWIGGDIHIYDTHKDLARRIVDLNNTWKLGRLTHVFSTTIDTLNLIYKPTSEEFLAEDFSLDGVYNPCIMDKAEMVV
jgi:thymidylate synthase